MDYFKLKKDIFTLRIEMVRKRINTLELALNTFRVFKDIRSRNNEHFSTEKINQAELKIAEVIQNINSSIQTLSKLEDELAALEEDNKNNSN